MEKYTGHELRELRNSLGLSRRQLAKVLDVSPVTVEKWEQASERPLREKYRGKLRQLASSKMGLATGIGLASPALIPWSVTLGLGALSLGALLSDESLDQAQSTLEQLRKLDPTERAQFLQLVEKMRS